MTSTRLPFALALVTAVTTASHAAAGASPAWAICSRACVPHSAAGNPGVASHLDSWSAAKGVELPQSTQDCLVSEFLCVETELQRSLPKTPSEELRAAGLEVLPTYLTSVLAGTNGNFAAAFARRLGAGALIQVEPRKYRPLRVVTSPVDASAAIDHTELPTKTCLATVGEHQLTATRDGFAPCERTISVSPGTSEVTEQCSLLPKR